MGPQVGYAELQAVVSWAYSGVCDLLSTGADPTALGRLADGLGLRTLAAQAVGCRPLLGEFIQVISMWILLVLLAFLMMLIV